MIDTGPGAAGNVVVDYIKSLGIKNIDILIGTHPHEDHIGKMAEVIGNFNVGRIYLPKVSHTTQTFAGLLETIKSEELRVSTAKSGVELDLGSGINAKFVAPNGTSYKDLNDYSAVLELSYGKNSFLFDGDAESISESEMLAGRYNLDVDVLKVGHHWSKSSSSLAFLSAVTPKYAVISVGADDSYGHPTKEALSALASVGAKVLRTDQAGTIIIESDGTNITVNKNESVIQPRAPNIDDNSLGSKGYANGPGPSEHPGSTSASYYIGNANTLKFHRPSCSYLPNPENQVILKTRQEAINGGYVPCKICKP